MPDQRQVNRVDRGLSKEKFREMMAKVCPSDAAEDEAMKALLGRLDDACGSSRTSSTGDNHA